MTEGAPERVKAKLQALYAQLPPDEQEVLTTLVVAAVQAVAPEDDVAGFISPTFVRLPSSTSRESSASVRQQQARVRALEAQLQSQRDASFLGALGAWFGVDPGAAPGISPTQWPKP
jgi:hypothetical protein